MPKPLMTQRNHLGRLTAAAVMVSFTVLVSAILPIGSQPTTLQEPTPPQVPAPAPTPAPVPEQPPPAAPVVYAYLITPYQDADRKVSPSRAYDLAEEFAQKFRDQLKQEPSIAVTPINEEYGSVKQCELAERCEIVTLYEESETKSPQVVRLRIKLKNRVLPRGRETHPGIEPPEPFKCEAKQGITTEKECQLWSLDTLAKRLLDHNKTWHKEREP